MYRYFILIVIILLTGCSNSESKYIEQISKLEQQVAGLENEVRSNEDLQSTIANLEKRNKELHYEIADLKNQDIDNETKTDVDFDVDKYLELEAKVSLLESEVQRLELENDALKGSYSSNDMTYGSINYFDGKIGLGEYSKPIESVYTLKIIGYDDASSWEHGFVDLTGEGRGNYLFEVHGTLYDFSIQYIDWDYESMIYDVREEVCYYDEIRDTDFLFNSILAEGIPSELISWKDDNGKEFYYLIGDPGLSGNVFPYIIISELVDLDKWWEE